MKITPLAMRPEDAEGPKLNMALVQRFDTMHKIIETILAYHKAVSYVYYIVWLIHVLVGLQV